PSPAGRGEIAALLSLQSSPFGRGRSRRVPISGYMKTTVALVLVTAAVGALGPRVEVERIWQGEWWRLAAGALAATRGPLLLLGMLAVAGAGRIYEARRGGGALVAAFAAGALAGFAAGAPAAGGIAGGVLAVAAALVIAAPGVSPEAL